MRRILLYLAVLSFLPASLNAQIIVSGSSGADASYTSLTSSGGAFAAINSASQTGNTIVITLTGNSIAETGANSLNNGNWNSLTVYPTGSGFTITGSFNGGLINLNGTSNVIFDGRVNASGSSADLSVINTNTGTSASTISFINSATNNIIRYCNLKGAGTGSLRGIIFFSTSSSGNGNDSNIIEYNNISGNPVNRPINAISSTGTSGRSNDGNIIRNNNFLDFLNPGATSAAILLGLYTSGWTISGNSFYETTTFAPSTTLNYYIIRISNNSGTGFTVSDNYIGGAAPMCTGSPFTKTNSSNNIFAGISLTVGTGSTSNIQNNIIRNISWSNSLNANWTGIEVTSGNVNIGTTSGNIIGSDIGTGSIVVTNSTTSGYSYGIKITSTGVIDCQNNKIGSFLAASTSSANSNNFSGIEKNGNSTSLNISNNIIGSLTTGNSIFASSGSTSNPQNVLGISNTGTGLITINGNQINNISNGSANTNPLTAGQIVGIVSTNGITEISGNTIRNLTIGNANNQLRQTASVCGIVTTGTSTVKTINSNTINNLSNTYPNFIGGIIGLYFEGSSGGNTVGSNFIHSLSVSSTSPGANIFGIRISSGSTTYSNNIIVIDGNTASTIYGIYETGSAGSTNKLYFNTLYIGGQPTSNNFSSYAFFSASSTNNKDFRNNIFANFRSNVGASGKHYAIRLLSNANLTIDYNNYYASGSGGILGSITTDKITLADWQAGTGQDANSFAMNPVFVNPGSTSATDYQIGVDLIGVLGTGITTDYGGVTRSNPTIGAWERPVNKWKGTISTDWNTPGNWTGNTLPLGNNFNFVFDDAPSNSCYLNADHGVNNITDAQSFYHLVLNGHKLIIQGNLILTGGAQIDATSPNSNLEYSGLNAQTIESNQFINNKSYNLTISNTMGVTLNSNFTVDNSLTINSGNLTITAPFLLNVPVTLTNNAGIPGLVIKSDANGNDAKLINSTLSVPATVELYLKGGLASANVGNFHYFVPPVASMAIDNSSVSAAAVSLGLDVVNFGGDLLLYDEIKATTNRQLGWQYFDGYGSTTGFSSLESTNGYNIYLTNSDKITFKGSLNSTDHSFNLNYTGTNVDPGWNLVGNPYPCDYDLTGIPEFLATDNVDNTAYFNHDGGYAYWNVDLGAGTTNFSNIVAPMQGFFVHVTAAGTLTLPASSKTEAAAEPTRSKKSLTASNPVKKIKLVLNNGPVPDETIVCLVDNATSGFDSDYDAYKLFGSGTTTPSIYTELNSIKYALNAVQGPQSDPVIIPVTVDIKTPGTYNIDITEFENLEGIPVVLKHGDIETTLSKNTSYSFTSATGIFTDFSLIFGEDISTGIEKTTQSDFKAWYSNNYVYVNFPGENQSGTGKLTIYDFNGKQVFNNTNIAIVSGQTMQIPVNLNKGFYIINISVNAIQHKAKIIVY